MSSAVITVLLIIALIVSVSAKTYEFERMFKEISELKDLLDGEPDIKSIRKRRKSFTEKQIGGD